MPVEFSLELMAIICLYSMDAEGKTAGEIVYKVNSAGLIVLIIDLQRPGSGGIIYSGVLIALNHTASRIFERQKLHINLNTMTWYLFLILLKLSH